MTEHNPVPTNLAAELAALEAGQNNPYQEYVRLLYEACHAHEAVDNFDVHSDDPESVQKWKVLLDEINASDGALIAHVQAMCARISAISNSEERWRCGISTIFDGAPD